MTKVGLQSIGQLPGGDLNALSANDPATLAGAAENFEAYFVGQVFEEAHKSIPKSDMFDNNLGMEFYESLFIQEAVKEAIKGGQGLGLSKYLDQNKMTQVTPKQEAPLMNPLVDTEVSSAFGSRKDPFEHTVKEHDGIDLKASTGTPIHAAKEGVVSFAGVQKGYGKVIKIDHGNGMETLYAHNSSNKVKVGDSVTSGQIIGLIGETGRATGPHLHFEVRQQGEAVNPASFINFSKRT